MRAQAPGRPDLASRRTSNSAAARPTSASAGDGRERSAAQRRHHVSYATTEQSSGTRTRRRRAAAQHQRVHIAVQQGGRGLRSRSSFASSTGASGPPSGIGAGIRSAQHHGPVSISGRTRRSRRRPPARLARWAVVARGQHDRRMAQRDEVLGREMDPVPWSEQTESIACSALRDAAPLHEHRGTRAPASQP